MGTIFLNWVLRDELIADTPREISSQIEQIQSDRAALFQNRVRLADLVRPWTLESWLCDVIQLAVTLT